MINVKESIKQVLVALFITYTLYEKFMLPELQIPMIISLLLIVSFLLVREAKKRTGKFKLHSAISYVIFSIFMVIGDSFKTYGSFHGIIGNPFKNTDLLVKLFEDFAPLFSFLNGIIGNVIMLFSAVCKGIGYYFIIGYFIEWLKYLFYNVDKYKVHIKNYEKYTNKIFRADNVFLNVFIILLVAWLPYFIIKFPGSVSIDAVGQIRQFLGEYKLTTHHPFFSTVSMGSCVKIGMLFGSQNIGVLLYVILQYIAMAAVFAYCISSINAYNPGGVYNWILLIFYAFSPAFPSYATFVVKDTFYCMVFTLFVLSLLKIVLNLKQGKSEKKDIFLCSVTSFLVMISRNNGIYSVVPTLIVLIMIWIIKAKEKIKVSCILALPILLYCGYDFLQYDVLKIEEGSIKEALSIPFQQTARYVKEHQEDVTEEEKRIINKVLDYDNLGELYIPTVSDPVKATYKGDKAALKEYFKVWFGQLKKHPVTYVEATVNTSYLAFYPDTPNIRAYGIISDMENSQLGGVFSMLRIVLLAFVMGLSLVPIVSIFINPVYYIWLLIYNVICSIFKKQLLDLIVFIPMIVQLMVVIAGPAVLNHPRYLYPIYWSILLTIPFIVEQSKKDETKLELKK